MECSICMEYKENIFRLKCTHAFCIDCLNKMEEYNNGNCCCPLCRKTFSLTELKKTFDSNKGILHQDIRLSKLVRLVSIV